MRVGFNGILLGGRHFGVEESIGQLALALARTRQGHDIKFYLRTSTQQSHRFLWSECAGNIHGVPLTRSRWHRLAWEHFALPRQLRENGIELLLAPGYVSPLRVGLPVVLTVHDLIAIQRPDLCPPLNRWHYRLSIPRSIKSASLVLTPSLRVRSEVISAFHLPEDRVEVVSPGIDPVFRNAPDPQLVSLIARRYRLPRDFILSVGSAEPKKNLSRLIEAYAIARQRGLASSLVLVGEKVSLDDSAAPPGLRTLGFVPRDHLVALYRLARLLAFPSLAEGFGLPVLEAMASGLPIVASAVPALEEVCHHQREGSQSRPEDYAIVVDPESLDSLAEGLMRGCVDEDRRSSLISRGLRVSRSFTWEEAACRSWELYRRIVN